MALSKEQSIILNLLINIQTEILTLKDFTLMNIAQNLPDNPLTDERKIDAVIDAYGRARGKTQNAVMAQLKNREDPNLGKIDDLLNGIFSE